ncbi:MAG: DUF4421 family protein [Bacteroidales bacterium]|nr:DUF4421 family protein [Bacteroidales bacterium]
MDDWLRGMQEKQPYDTTYIFRPQERWLIRERTKFSAESLRMLVLSEDGQSYGAAVADGGSFKQSIGVGYRSIALDIGTNLSAVKTGLGYDLNVFGNRIVFKHNFRFSYGMTGQAYSGTQELAVKAKDLAVLNVSAGAYYAFNGKRFSMPAALNQNFRQLKSAGSLLATIDARAIGLFIPEPETLGIPMDYSYMFILGLGGGYGYNWVPSEHWLIHLSLTGTVGFLKATGLSLTGRELIENAAGPPIIMTKGTAAVLYYVGNWYFGLFADGDSLTGFTTDDVTFFLRRVNANASLTAGVRF